ncbi:YiiX/YebB-like N1pC/P60 family cysteine hydrolase [Kribbella sp. DT2]|uniref:YiiX/YebB-like N1pC/P60 family cysteine hydrolase n=1 Tax=Kribbella sp. DT2 TaxID=3393427 RepID=UPI003CEAF5CE
MKWMMLSVAATATLAVSLPTTAFAQTTAAPGPSAADVRTTQELIDAADSAPLVAGPNAAAASGKVPSLYPRNKGAILVTPDPYKGLPLGHSAIVLTDNTVVESVAEGVKLGPNNWYQSKKQVYGTIVQATSSKQNAKAADWAAKQRHKPYNYNYLDINTRKKFYCSQLIYAAFKDNFGINLNTDRYKTPVGNPVHPMELAVKNPKVGLIYRQK